MTPGACPVCQSTRLVVEARARRTVRTEALAGPAAVYEEEYEDVQYRCLACMGLWWFGQLPYADA